MSGTQLVMSVCVLRQNPFSNSDLFELTAVIRFCIAATVVVAAGHETDPPNYETMWEDHKTGIGKECDNVCEESVLFGNSPSNVQVICAANAQNFTHLMGLTRLPVSCPGRCCHVHKSRPANLWSGLTCLARIAGLFLLQVHWKMRRP